MANQAQNTEALNANKAKLDLIDTKVTELLAGGGGDGEVSPALQTAIDANIAATDQIASRLGT